MLPRSVVVLAAVLALAGTVPHSGGASPLSKIVFESDRDGTLQIYTMNADGSRVTNLTHGPGESISAAFSPDGHNIAFRSNREGTDQLYIMDADGSHQTARGSQGAHNRCF